MQKVTPQFEFTPERTYLREGNVIRCHAITNHNPCSTNPQEVLLGVYLFTVTLPSVEAAEQLMTDLYYGEYTGA